MSYLSRRFNDRLADERAKLPKTLRVVMVFGAKCGANEMAPGSFG
jgi:hypothetical protein